MEIAAVNEVHSEWRADVTRKGKTPRKWLLVEEAEDGLSFRLVRSEYQPGDDAFETPRHHHAFQQIRWAERGALNFAPEQYVSEGEIAYFPRGTYYGPQRRDSGVGITLQFGFGREMLGGKNASATYRAGVEKLKARGRIEGGLFVDIDPETGQERRRDPAEAVAEEITGESYRIPSEGYAAPILMHPDAFVYYQAGAGVELKHLGSFYDHAGPNADVIISVLRLSAGGVHKLGGERAQVAWSTGALLIGGRNYPDLTCLYSPRSEEIEISSSGTSEIYLVELPRLD